MKPYFQRDGITLYHGDCRDVLPTIEAGSVDLVLTDPPYGVDLGYDNCNDSLQESGDRIILVINEGERIARCVLTTVGMFAIETRLYRERPPRWRLCWRKGITSRPSPIGFTDWEPVFVYGRDIHRHSHDLFTVQPEKMGRFGHPCPKPVGFAKWLIERFTDEGESVLDPFAGSGTTLRAAMDLGRRAIGIEISEKYCEIAAKRLEQRNLQFAEAM